MPIKEHLDLIIHGVEAWNKWRQECPEKNPDLSEADLSEVSFRGANLRGVNLSGAYLRFSDFTKANLVEANLTKAKLGEAVLRYTNLSKANLSHGNLRYANLSKANLGRARLIGACLIGAYLYKARLRDADLRNADLSEANLIATDFRGAEITGATLYGSARDDWEIDSIMCDYVFWDQGGIERIPKDRDFELCEFEELYRQLPTIEYIFRNGFTPIDAFVMDRVVQAINKKYPKMELKLDSFHSRGKPRAVFTIIDFEYADKAFEEIKDEYETKIRVLEGKREELIGVIESITNKPQCIQVIEQGAAINRYEISGQAGAVGHGAHIRHINFNQLWNQASSEVDLEKLAQELSQLRLALKEEANTLEHDASIGEIAADELTAQNGEGPSTLEHLTRAGKWALGVAEKIGTSIATSALKSALSL